MSNKLIDLNALSEYKTKADQKYQDKLTAGSSITINNGVISVTPYYSGDLLSGSKAIGNSVTEVGNITLAPGNYILTYTCQFNSNSTGYRQCGFSTNATTLDSLGSAYWDSRMAANGVATYTRVVAIFQVSAETYPNGRTFYFVAKKYNNSSTSLTAYPRAYYFKF